MAGEQTKTARRGPPRVGNDSGGRLDAKERAHGRSEHGNAGEGSAVDLEDGGTMGAGSVGGLDEKGEKYPRSLRGGKGLCKRLPLSVRVHKQNNFV